MGAMSLATLLSVIFYWFGKGDITLIFVFQVLISICAGSIFPLLWSMYADCADYSELKTGNRATGLIFSSSSMSQKFGWAIGSALTGWLLAYFGFRANEVQSVEAIHGIKMFLQLVARCRNSSVRRFYQYVSAVGEEDERGDFRVGEEKKGYSIIIQTSYGRDS